MQKCQTIRPVAVRIRALARDEMHPGREIAEHDRADRHLLGKKVVG